MLEADAVSSAPAFRPHRGRRDAVAKRSCGDTALLLSDDGPRRGVRLLRDGSGVERNQSRGARTGA